MERYNQTYPVRTEYDPTRAIDEYFKGNEKKKKKAFDKAAEKMKLIERELGYQTIHVVMYEYPMRTERPRTAFGGRHVYSPNAADNHSYFEKAVKSVIKTFKLINTPAEIHIEAYMEMPRAVKPDEVVLFELKALYPVDPPDYDNIGKCYTDMLKNVLIVDDDIFYRGSITKFYSLVPRVEFYITYQDKHTSDFIYKKICSRKSVKELVAQDRCEVTVIGSDMK